MNPSNQRKFLEQFAQKNNIQTPQQWGEVTVRQVSKLFIHFNSRLLMQEDLDYYKNMEIVPLKCFNLYLQVFINLLFKLQKKLILTKIGSIKVLIGHPLYNINFLNNLLKRIIFKHLNNGEKLHIDK